MKKSSERDFLRLHLCGYGFEDAALLGNKLHFHPFWQMNMVCGGYAFYRTAAGERRIQAGDVIISPPGVRHNIKTVEGCGFCDYSFKFFPGDEFSADQVIFSDPEMRKMQLVWINALGEIFKSIVPPELIRRPVEFPISPDTPGIELIEELLYGFCRRLCDKSNSGESWLLKKIKLAVQSRKGKPLTVSECAGEFNCSSGYLLSLIKKETGLSTKEIIDRERIKIARQFLAYSDITVSQLAEKMGFRDLIYFERFFRKYCGETPSAFRKREKAVLTVSENNG